MQKLVTFLEKHVQWVAIGLGVLFVLFMTWTYVIDAPAKVTMNHEILSPGEVDPYTVEHPVKKLEAELAKNEKIEMQVPTYVQVFKDTMAWKGVPEALVQGIWPSQPPNIEIVAAPDQGPGAQPAPPGAVVQKVKELPKLPPPIPADWRFGRSVILPPAPPPDQAQPGGPAVQPVLAPQPRDQDWVTQKFKIPMPAIDQAFKESLQIANLPQELYKTAFLQLEMIREEKLPNGTWGNQIVVMPLATWRTAAPPPFPAGADAQRDAQAAYLNWAIGNQPDILQPAFFLVQKGDPWQIPGQLVTSAQNVFDPATYKGPATSPPLTAEQRDAVNKWRQEDYKKRQEEKKKNVTPKTKSPGTPRGAPGADGAMFAPRDPQQFAAAPARQPTPAPQPRQPYPTPARQRVPDAMEGMPGMDGSAGTYPGAGAYPGAAGAAQLNLPQAGVAFPNTDFDPAQWKEPIDVWVHDGSVEAGKTYRYKMHYKLKNPIWTTNVAVNPDLANTFALVSPDSPWGPDVTVPPLVNFFVASSVLPNRNSVNFDVFRWEKGQQTQETFIVAPGDQVGGNKKHIDYHTGWTVVDLRYDSRAGEQQILLVDDSGNMVTRSYGADQKNPLYQQLKEAIQQARATETAGLAAGNGAPAPPAR